MKTDATLTPHLTATTIPAETTDPKENEPSTEMKPTLTPTIPVETSDPKASNHTLAKDKNDDTSDSEEIV